MGKVTMETLRERKELTYSNKMSTGDDKCKMHCSYSPILYQEHLPNPQPLLLRKIRADEGLPNSESQNQISSTDFSFIIKKFWSLAAMLYCFQDINSTEPPCLCLTNYINQLNINFLKVHLKLAWLRPRKFIKITVETLTFTTSKTKMVATHMVDIG